MQIIFSNRALQDRSRQPDAFNRCVSAFLKALKSVPDFRSLHYHHGIKRLKYIKPNVWRHRHGDWRTVFSIPQRQPDLVFAIHRCAQRHSVYNDLPEHIHRQIVLKFTDIRELDDLDEAMWLEDSLEIECLDDQCSEHDRYYLVPPSLIKDELTLDTLVGFIDSGHYLRSPYLTPSQQNVAQQLCGYQSGIYTVQGAAGTGKTSVALDLAFKANQKNLFPVIILPNQNLVRFGLQSLKSLDPHVQIHCSNTTCESPDLAIFSRDEIIHQMSRDQEPCLSWRQGNQIVHSVIHRQIGSRHQSIRDFNLYHLYCAYVGDNSYLARQKDPVAQMYTNALYYLESYKNKISDALNKKDLLSQAQRARDKCHIFLESFKQIVGDRSLFLIIDEVQDFYWSQLYALLRLSQSQMSSSAVILLGDENQRVTLSGFSWAALSEKIHQNFEIIPKSVNFTSQNFRNTGAITKAANFLLKNAFNHRQFSARTRHFPDPSKPEECFKEGNPPRLIKADPNWFQSLVEQLCQQPMSESDSSRYVFIVQDEDRDSPFAILLSKKNDTPIVVYTVAEAKGQDFDAAVLVYPFRIKENQLSVDHLYEWYTSVTRARSYLAILVSDDEFCWLNQNLSDQQSLHEIFDVVETPQPEEFAQQMQFEARTLVTIEQLRQKQVRKLVRELQNCLMGKVKLRDFGSDCDQTGLSIWELAEHIYQTSQDIDNWEAVIKLEQISLEVPVSTLFFDDLLLFLSSSVYLNNSSLNCWEDRIVVTLEDYFRSEPEVAKQALTQISEPYLRVLILRALGYSWDAAIIASNTTDQERLIHCITRDLERRSLPLESARIKTQFLKQECDSSIFPVTLLQNKKMITDALCEEFIKSLNTSLEINL